MEEEAQNWKAAGRAAAGVQLVARGGAAYAGPGEEVHWAAAGVGTARRVEVKGPAVAEEVAGMEVGQFVGKAGIASFEAAAGRVKPL